MSTADTPRYLSIPQLARRMDCGHSTLYAMIRAGTFPFPIVQVGADKRVPLEAVERFESGKTTDEAKLLARVESLEARVALHEERERQAFGALSAAYTATPVVAPPASLGAVSDIGEKSHEEGLCRDELPGQSLPGRIARPPLRAGGNHGCAHETRGIQPAPRPHGGGGQARDGATLRAEGKTKRPRPGGQFVG